VDIQRIDSMELVSIEEVKLDEVKKSFATLADREDLQLDPDLMYARFIMCHEGANANGDYFTKDVLHSAQFTPRLKPINWEHGQPIIGAILDSRYAEDAQGRGYIEAVGVIWKFIYSELANSVKEKSRTGELRLSMECYYKDANYKYGETIYDQERAEDLGLVDYVGREYMGNKVYRVFKEVLFGGVGVVANPADKEAVFLAVAKKKAEAEEELEQAIADIIRTTNDFNEKQLPKDTINAVTVAKYVKAFDKAKSLVVSKFNKDEILTRERLMAEVRTIVDELLSEVSNINNDYFVGRASEDNLEGVEVSDLNLQLCDHCQDNIEENKGGSETMDKEKLETVVDEVEVTETAVAEETTEEVAVEEVQVEEVATKVTEEVEVEVVDYQAKATDLETKVAQLTQELQTKATAYETLEAELTALKNKVEASEKETLVNSRMSELTELGIEFSEARKAKELDKISAMDNESFADYKEFLSELSGKKVEVAEATEEVVEETVEEEIEVEVEVEKAEASALNIETPQPKVIKPFGHLSE
jgi:hypothetical protein